MTPDIALVLLILLVAIVLLVWERIPMEVVALLTLGAVALTGLVEPNEALSGFSNPAVVTVWAVFILSGGLTRTGVANIIGRHVLRMAGSGETRIVLVIMVSAGVMSAFMNNVAVAALMLPVTMDIARQTKRPPSKLLMPLAFGSLLGGLTTMIGTPPNILVSNALRDQGLPHFRLFDYTPVGVTIMAAGVAFMTLVGRRLLPTRDVAKESSAAGHLNLQEQYDLHERMFLMGLPADSVFVGKSLVESRLGSALGLHVVGIIRNGRTQLAPSPSTLLQAGDRLLVEGRLERVNELSGWRQLTVVEPTAPAGPLLSEDLAAAEACLSPDSLLAGKSLRETEFRKKHAVSVVALCRDGEPLAVDVRTEPLQADDLLLFHGARQQLEALKKSKDFFEIRLLSESELADPRRLGQRLIRLRVPEVSILLDKTLKEARLGEALGVGVLLLERKDGTRLAPAADTTLMAGDTLVVKGKFEDLRILQGLEQLEIQQEAGELESVRVGLAEAVLSPRTTLAGKTLRQLQFREKYGLSVLAIWRKGRPYRTNLAEMPLQLGDALLLYGPRERLQLLGREPDFLVLTAAAQEMPRREKARLAALIMCAVLLPVILGVTPIYIAAVVGAALMVLTRCLTMEEAYRAIEWKAVFLIAGLLPLGVALDKTGAAKLLAEGVVTMVGPFGPMAVMAGLMSLTFLATCVVPTAALVVLMSPIVLSASADLGVSPHAMMMAMAMAASSSFTSPISHPANLLMMGPGGYRFVDYVKVGVPLTLVVLVVALVFVPIFWPLR